jgi:dipeptidyl aminopeptidase/acylaminoacyl peptidase
MKKLLGLLLLFMPMFAVAQNAIDGTWRIDLNKAQMDSKPRVFELKDGMYSCSTCDPKIMIKADGMDHPVSGSPYFNTGKITVVDPSTVEMTGMKDGKVTLHVTMMVSADGKTLTRKVEEHPAGSNQVSTVSGQFDRIGEPQAGAHMISGSWRMQKLESASENWLTFTFASNSHGLDYKASTGENYSASFDGKDYPYKGDPGTTSVVLKRIDNNTIEETDKRDGEVVFVSRITVSPDGKSLTMVSEDKRRGITDTWVAEKEAGGDAMADK